MLTDLNRKYQTLNPQQRISELYNDFSEILLTSSFGTTSAYLLHLFKTVRPQQDVYFLDTGYHFNETLSYKDQLQDILGFRLSVLRPEEWKHNFTIADRTWANDPDLCCSLNKVEPLAAIRDNYQVWVSGLMADQNSYRRKLRIFEEKDGIIKFYPIVDQNEAQALEYIARNNLPMHPLLAAGFNSVGCVHCTVAGKGRSGRWTNKSKTECGLHL
jgi:phosphoadenosine phosphosulfate reductase